MYVYLLCVCDRCMHAVPCAALLPNSYHICTEFDKNNVVRRISKKGIMQYSPVQYQGHTPCGGIQC